jgi:hypothetical protein
MRARIFVAAIALSAIAYACGGVDSDLISGSASDGGNSGDASTGRDSGVRDGSTSSRDSGSGGDGGTPVDSGSDGGVVNPKSDGGILQCGTNDSTSFPMTVTCNVADPVCCASQYPFDNVNPVSFACTTNAASCSDPDAGAIPIVCRSNADCPGTTQCCGHEITYNTIPADPITVYEYVRCQASCPLFLPDAGETAFRLFCDPSAPVNVCPAGESCGASTLLPGFNVCGTP